MTVLVAALYHTYFEQLTEGSHAEQGEEDLEPAQHGYTTLIGQVFELCAADEFLEALLAYIRQAELQQEHDERQEEQVHYEVAAGLVNLLASKRLSNLTELHLVGLQHR